jgi:hypothetical protein
VTALIQQQVDTLLESAATQPLPRLEPTRTDTGGSAADKTELAPIPSHRRRWRLTLAGAALIVGIIGGVLAYVFWPEGTQVIPPAGSETSASCHLSDAGMGPYSRWSVGANTSCGFGLNAARAVNHMLQQQTANLPAHFELVDVPSGATGLKYDMTCVLDRKLMTCTGGNPTATVYVW